MPCPGEGPCQVWDLDLGCCLVSGGFADPCLGDGTPVPQEIIDSMVLAASQFMWAATGRQFGCCTVSIRPCRACRDECCIPGDTSGATGFPWYPLHQADGSWINVSCPCQDQCSCVNLCEIQLPYPVCSVDEVIIDGIVIDPATYRVDDFRKLVRVGDECWPKCNDLTQPPTEIGTWQITVTYGKPIPQLVRLAANEFACQLIKKCVGKPCDLPQRIQSINRQGMSATFLDPMEFMANGLTGIFLVDLAIKTYNPHRLYKKPSVVSPDSINKWRVSTWENGDPVSGVCT